MYFTFPALERIRFQVGIAWRNHHSLDEFGHLSDGVLDWDRWVSTVEVVEVDVIYSQPRQGLAEGLVDVLWVSLHDSIWFSVTETKLGGEEDLVALSGLLEPILPNRGQRL